MTYVTAGSRKQVVDLYWEIFKIMPVDWQDPESIKKFKTASEKYAKAWTRLNYEEQGLVCEIISELMQQSS